jgi:hypothetical protein
MPINGHNKKSSSCSRTSQFESKHNFVNQIGAKHAEALAKAGWSEHTKSLPHTNQILITLGLKSPCGTLEIATFARFPIAANYLSAEVPTGH